MLAHELIVGGLYAVLTTLIRTVVKGPIVLQRSAGRTVVIDDEDVVVRVPALAVAVGDDQSIGIGVHPLGQLVPEIVHALEVGWVARVELVLAERLAVMERLHRSTVGLGERPRCHRPRPGWARDVARDRDPAGVVLAPHVRLGRRCGSTRRVVARTHAATRSPSRLRTSRRRLITSVSRARSTCTRWPERARRSRSLTLIASGRI